MRPTRAFKLLRLSGVALVVALAVATVATVPASAQSYKVTVELADGTLQSVVMDLPEGTMVDQLVGYPGLPGTPVSVEVLAAEVAQEEPPPAEPPPAEPAPEEPPVEPAPTEPAPTDPPPTDPPPAAGPVDDPASTPEATPPAPPQQTTEEPASAPSDEPTTQRKPRRDRWEPKTEKATGPSGGVEAVVERSRTEDGHRKLRNADGTPTRSNPGFTDVLPGPSTASGVPNFIIRKFRVPPFLLPIYQAAGIEYGIRWEILAAINEIETDYGRNLNVSSAGALGWMQFMPSTWQAYGTDANKDGRKDPYNPVDAIFAAARYLNAAGYEQDVRRAIFAYNHADWYVDSVLLRARLIAGVPADLIGSLTGLTEGRFPVDARARYANDLAEHGVHSIDIFANTGAQVVAVNDGVVKRIGRSSKLGRHITLQDVYGNRYTYAGLGSTPARLERGDRVIGGKRLGRIGRTVAGKAAHLRFSIRPSGAGAPTIDPKPILDGWKLLEATSIYRANGKNVMRGGASVGQVLLLSKELLEKRVLADERIEIYGCGRDDIRAGIVDRRVLASLAYLAESGLEPTVTSLRCGHSYYTSSGNVSHHSSGNAVDIAKINGIPVLGHQEPGGVTDQAVRRLAQLQGTLAPAQIISLFELGGATIAMGDHADHIHVGFDPGSGADGRRPDSVLKPDQWPKLLDRLSEIENPRLRDDSGD